MNAARSGLGGRWTVVSTRMLQVVCHRAGLCARSITSRALARRRAGCMGVNAGIGQKTAGMGHERGPALVPVPNATMEGGKAVAVQVLLPVPVHDDRKPATNAEGLGTHAEARGRLPTFVLVLINLSQNIEDHVPVYSSPGNDLVILEHLLDVQPKYAIQHRVRWKRVLVGLIWPKFCRGRLLDRAPRNYVSSGLSVDVSREIVYLGLVYVR